MASLSVACISLVVGSVALAYYFAKDLTLAYVDAKSHLMIANRVLLGAHPGLAQLGGIWLPLPHVLMLPFVWDPTLFYSGLAGSLVSLASYVVATTYVYRLVWALTASRGPAAIASAVLFAVNPNVLYMAATPMTELLLLALAAASAYHLNRWIQSRSYTHLVPAALAIGLATLTRYEAWVLLPSAMLVIAYVTYRTRHGRGEGQANVILFTSLGAVGVIGWLVWCQLLLGDWLYWRSNADYLHPGSSWVAAGGAMGNVMSSVRIYWAATVGNVGLPVLGLAGAGLVAYLVRTRVRPEAVAPLVLLTFFPFYVFTLYTGQRQILIPPYADQYYNVRFGLPMVLPAAVFGGLFVGSVASAVTTRLRVASAGAVISGVLVMPLAVAAAVVDMNVRAPIDVLEATRGTGRPASDSEAGLWLREHYDGGRILMENFDNERVTFDSRVPLNRYVYEGDYKLWRGALRAPTAHGVRWIVMRMTPGSDGRRDTVYRALHDSPALARYRRVAEVDQRRDGYNQTLAIYRLGGA